MKKGARRVILALPIIAKSVAKQLDSMVDHIYAVQKIEHLTQLDAYYLNKMTNEESVKAFLDSNFGTGKE